MICHREARFRINAANYIMHIPFERERDRNVWFSLKAYPCSTFTQSQPMWCPATLVLDASSFLLCQFLPNLLCFLESSYISEIKLYKLSVHPTYTYLLHGDVYIYIYIYLSYYLWSRSVWKRPTNPSLGSVFLCQFDPFGSGILHPLATKQPVGHIKWWCSKGSPPQKCLKHAGFRNFSNLARWYHHEIWNTCS